MTITPFHRTWAIKFFSPVSTYSIPPFALHYERFGVFIMRTGIPSWHALKLMALGAVSFWTPDIIWHAIRGPEFGKFDVLAMSVLMPSTLTGMYILLRKRLAHTAAHRNVGLPLMLGIWTLGMFFMGIAATVSGGGFVGPYPWDGVIASLSGLLLFPTFVMATYDGSLGALVVATLAAIVIAVRRRRLIPT